MSPRTFGRTMSVLVLLALAALFVWSGMAHAQDLNQVVNVVEDANNKTKSVAAAMIVLLGSLLAIALVVILYKRAANS